MADDLAAGPAPRSRRADAPPPAALRDETHRGIVALAVLAFAGCAAGTLPLEDRTPRVIITLVALAMTALMVFRARLAPPRAALPAAAVDGLRRLATGVVIVAAVVVVVLAFAGETELIVAAVVIVAGLAALPLASIVNFPLLAVAGLGLVPIGIVSVALGVLDAEGAQTVGGVGGAAVLWIVAFATSVAPRSASAGPTRIARRRRGEDEPAAGGGSKFRRTRPDRPSRPSSRPERPTRPSGRPGPAPRRASERLTGLGGGEVRPEAPDPVDEPDAPPEPKGRPGRSRRQAPGEPRRPPGL